MKILVFGGTGSLGSEFNRVARLHNHDVTIASRSPDLAANEIGVSNDFHLHNLKNIKFDAVVWAQGKNINDDALLDAGNLNELWSANIEYIHTTFTELFNHNLLNIPVRLVVIGSVWQKIARKNKFSYIVSKSAVEGLISSITADFAEQGITIHAVLPGVIDTPMTRANLSDSQIAAIKKGTPTGRLVAAEEVANTILWLASPKSSGVVGQCITIDNGWSNYRDL
jgi:short-subunit dehydrogenase